MGFSVLAAAGPGARKNERVLSLKGQALETSAIRKASEGQKAYKPLLDPDKSASRATSADPDCVDLGGRNPYQVESLDHELLCADALRGRRRDPDAMDSPATDIRVLRAIRRIIRAVDLHSKTLQQAQDVTAPQLVCLLTLVRQGPQTLKGLSAAIDLSPSTTVGVVDRLAAKGLAERTRSTHDRRQVLVSATAAGRALAQRSPSPLQDRLVTRLGALPVAEQLALAQALERLVTLMGASEIDASAILDLAPIAEAGETGAAATGPAPAAAREAAPDTPPGRPHPAAAALAGATPPRDDPASRLAAPEVTPLTRHTVVGAWSGKAR